jgi:ComF family protein
MIEIADALLAVLLAPECASCGGVLDQPASGPVCDACWAAASRVIGPFCEVCGDPLVSWRVVSAAEGVCVRCRRAPVAFDRGRAAGEYEGTLREIIHAFKYDGRRSLARPLAAMMRTAGSELLRDADFVVPVPLHPWRRLRRGFNQAEDLAAWLDRPIVKALRRARATQPQSGLTARQRRRNVRDAFRLSRRLRARTLKDASVVLVDDVRTTGATLDACARVLKDAGARSVRVLTVARAGRGRPGVL